MFQSEPRRLGEEPVWEESKSCSYSTWGKEGWGMVWWWYVSTSRVNQWGMVIKCSSSWLSQLQNERAKRIWVQEWGTGREGCGFIWCVDFCSCAGPWDPTSSISSFADDETEAKSDLCKVTGKWQSLESNSLLDRIHCTTSVEHAQWVKRWVVGRSSLWSDLRLRQSQGAFRVMEVLYALPLGLVTKVGVCACVKPIKLYA